jgi:ribonuclease E
LPEERTRERAAPRPETQAALTSDDERDDALADLAEDGSGDLNADPERKRRRRRSRRGRRSPDDAGLSSSDGLDADGNPISEQDETVAENSAAPSPTLAMNADSAVAQVAAAEVATYSAVKAEAVASEAQQVVAPRSSSTRAPAPPAAYNDVGDASGSDVPERFVARPETAAAPAVQAAPVAEIAPVVTEAIPEVQAREVETAPAVQAAPIVEAAPAVAPVVTPEVAPVVVQEAAPVAQAPAEVEAAPVQAVAQEQAVPVQAAVQPAETPASAPIVMAPKPEATQPSLQALNDVVAQKGLSWVETDPQRFAQTQERIAKAQTPVRLGRERKPVAPVAGAPLKQVETSD